ncbi:MAG: ATP-binding protein [Candidatus Falkowbacteria bacterium]
MAQGKKLSSVLLYVYIPGLLVIAILAVLNFFIYRQEFGFFYNIYANELTQTKSAIKQRFQSALIAAESTRAFFVSSQSVTKDEFTSYAEILTRNMSSGTIALPITLEWIDPQNKIRYVYPMNADNAKIIDLDLNQYPNRLLPITKAVSSKSSVITEPIMLAQGYPGLLLYTPIFKADQYQGQVVVVIRLANLLAPTAGNYPTYNKFDYIQTSNFIVPFDNDIIVNNNGEQVINPQGQLAKNATAQKYLAIDKGVLSESIVFADKAWQLKFSPAYIAEVNKRFAIYIIVSFLFAFSSILFLWALHKRRDQISKEKARAEALILGIGDGVVACDKSGKVIFINSAAEKLTGYSSTDSIGKAYDEIWSLQNSKGNAIPPQKRLIHLAITKKTVINVSVANHLYIQKKNGTRFPLAATIAPIIVDNIFEGAIAIFRDITKESEIDRMKTEFLSLATHQLLTPSTAIKWLSDVLLKGDLGPINKKQKFNLQSIYTANESMINLVNSLLNVSRIESGRIMVKPEPTELPSLLNEIKTELTSRLSAKKLSLDINTEKNLPKINIDPRLISEVYKNLLTNAIKYTPAKGNITVTIKKIKNGIISTVTDDGYGIPTEDKKKIFSKFYRGANITEIEKDGNGLGLYLVKQIIDVSGGQIGFNSTPGKGTSFWFSLPLTGSKPKAGEVTIAATN